MRGSAPCGRSSPLAGRTDIERLVTPCVLADDERLTIWIAQRRRIAPSSAPAGHLLFGTPRCSRNVCGAGFPRMSSGAPSKFLLPDGGEGAAGG